MLSFEINRLFYNDCLLCAGQCGAAVGHYNDTCVLAVAGERGIKLCLQILTGLQVDAAYKISGHVAVEIDICLFQNHGDGSGLVASQLEFAGYMLNHNRGPFRDPVIHFSKNLLRPVPLSKRQPREYSRRPYRMLCVVQSLLSLVKIDILGISACRNDYDVCPVGNLDFVKLIQKAAALSAGLNKMSGHTAANAFFLIQNYIYNKGNRNKTFTYLVNIFADGIALDSACLCLGLHHAGVIALDAFRVDTPGIMALEPPLYPAK